ncbi:unnamed protein product [Phytomonas sp. Hart1]|nr:unnamed protein product [Phytomonas sp. Hart1]|eukprot:CCW66857.1 unnamed protein product [Phytomonas sp. isolate Hart1]
MDDSPCQVYLEACKRHGVKLPNPDLVKFLLAHDSFSEIEEIDVGNNYLGNRGILALLEVVKALPKIRFLNLSDQKLYNTDLNQGSVKGNATMDAVVALCGTHPTLTSLDLSRNPIGNYAGRRLLGLAQANPNLSRIELANTQVDFDLRQRIKAQCDGNTKALWFSHTTHHDEGAEVGFGEGPTWVPQAAPADLTALGAGRRRRQTVRVEGIDPEKAKHYRPPVHEKSDEETRLICDLLAHNVLFSFLSTKDIRSVAGAMYPMEFKRDECIMQFGQKNCDKLYVIQSGQADIIKEGQKVFLKKEGTAVGELELLYDTPAVATVKVCTSNLVAWVLDRETYRNMVMGSSIRRRELYVAMIANIPFLESLDHYERMQVADALSSNEFNPGDYIITHGEMGEWLHIIIDGIVEVIGRDEQNNKTKVCEFTKGDHIGELEFLNNHRNVADVVAVTHVTTAKLNRRHFEMCMGPVIDVLKRDSTSSKYKYYQNILQTQRQEDI